MLLFTFLLSSSKKMSSSTDLGRTSNSSIDIVSPRERSILAIIVSLASLSASERAFQSQESQYLEISLMSSCYEKSILDLLFRTLPKGCYEKSLVFGEKNLNGSIKLLVAMVSTSHPVLDLLGVVNMLKISGFSLGGRSETVVFQSPPRITGVSLNLFKNSSILLKKDLLSSTLGP